MPEITLVVGPPGGGKTTWVEKHGVGGAVVVDLDSLQEALGGAAWGSGGHWDAAMGAREGVLRKLRRGEVDAQYVYLISANPRAETLFPYHHVQVVDPGIEVALNRVGAREGGGGPRPASHIDLVRRWYAERSRFGTEHRASGPSRDW